MKKFRLILMVLAVSLISTLTVADTISFHTQNDTSSWTYGGGASSYTGTTFNATAGTVQLDANIPLSILNMTVTVTTGAGAPVGPTTVLFSSVGSVFSISGDVGAGVETLFTGVLASPSLIQLGTGGSGATAFSANFVVGTISADAQNFIYGFGGHTGGTLSGSFSSTNTGLVNTITGGAGAITGSTTTLETVPEPASLALLGTGLLAGGNFVRRKYSKR